MQHIKLSGLTLPREIEEYFSVLQILCIKESGNIYELVRRESSEKEQKSSMKNDAVTADEALLPEKHCILKIIPQKYYDKNLYEQLSSICCSGLLLPTMEYHDRDAVFFLYPLMTTLLEAVSEGNFKNKDIRNLLSELGSTLLCLHEHSVLHFDISPGNIYITKEGHFLLGDFSSAVLFDSSKTKTPFTKKPKKTGYTPGFFPVHAPENPGIHFDIYGFCKILSILIRYGAYPKKEESIKILNDYLSECESPPIKTDTLSEIIRKIKPLVENDEISAADRIVDVPDSEHEFFADDTLSITDNCFQKTEEKHIFFKQESFLGADKIKDFLLHLKFPVKTIQTKDSRRISLYGVLILCGLIFLYSVYHTAAVADQTQISKEQTIPETDATPAANISMNTDTKTPSADLSQMPDTTGSTFPAKTSQAPDNNEKTQKAEKPVPVQTVLDISHQNQKDSSFLEKISNPEQILTIFAEGNLFTGPGSFLSFPHLKELYLNQNHLCSLQGISALSSLEILDLSENKISDLSELSKLNNLKILDLAGQKSLKHYDTLKKLTSLQYLILTNTNLSASQVTEIQTALPDCNILF